MPNLNKASLHRFYLSSRHFSSLSKLFLKEFLATKNIMMQFGQVYLEYLHCLEKRDLIEYKRDGWYKYDEGLKMGLKMVGMFLDKCVKSAEDALNQKEENLTQKSTVDSIKKASQKVIEKCK